MSGILPWKRKKETRGDKLSRDIDKMFDRFFEPGLLPSSYVFGESKWDPTIDISEGRKEITVRAEIPGIEAKDLDISIDGRLLSIKGEKKIEQTDKDESYYRVERSYGYFNRTIELPAEVDSKEVSASYKRGVLKIKLRKTKTYETKRIEVKTG